MRSEAKGWYEAERGLDARGGPDAWRGNRRPGAGAIGLSSRGEARRHRMGSFCRPCRRIGPICRSGCTASQTVSYNSNINAVALGFAAPRAKCSAISHRRPILGFSTKANVYGQQLYLDATFGVIRYLHQTDFDSNVYSVSAGDNWTLTSRCSGNLGVTLSKSPVEITDLVATGSEPASTTPRRRVQRNRKMRGLQRIFVGVQQQLERTHELESHRRD